MELLLKTFGGGLLGFIVGVIIVIMIACFRVSSACSREEERQELERSKKQKLVKEMERVFDATEKGNKK